MGITNISKIKSFIFRPKRLSVLPLGKSHLFSLFIRNIGGIFFKLRYNLAISGMKNIPERGPAILLPKHQYWQDLPILDVFLKKNLFYAAKKELFQHIIIRDFFLKMGAIPIDRENTIKSLKSFKFIIKLLNQDSFLVIFPEGKYVEGRIGQGKKGLLNLILKYNKNKLLENNYALPFVPIGITYKFGFFRTKIYLKIGEPIYWDGKETAIDLTNRIINSIASLCEL
jgi:1-acyl-sn-glycerol-3-phosphate acyltransferase